MEHAIDGTIAQHLDLRFERDDEAWLANGSLVAHGPGVEWNLAVPGGIGSATRRALSGEGFSLTRVRATGPGQSVRAAASEPGHLATWVLDDGADGPVVTTRGAFLAAWGEIDIDVTVARRAGAALFGGAGLFLQRVSGRGTVVIHASGDLIERRLAAGERLVVSTGNLAAFSGSADYDIETVGSVRKFFFAGEGLFMTRLTGPGRVLLQSLKRRSARSQGAS